MPPTRSDIDVTRAVACERSEAAGRKPVPAYSKARLLLAGQVTRLRTSVYHGMPSQPIRPGPPTDPIRPLR
jgi:hypothetical protein